MREEVSRGAGGELVPTATGKRRAHAPYSSAAFAANTFGRWIGHEAELMVAGLRGFSEAIVFEKQLRISHCGGVANLDCFLEGPELVAGIECKLTETLATHEPVPWRDPYLSSDMARVLTDGWARVFESSLAGTWAPRHLGIEQLVKHALAITGHHRDSETHLVYCYWEPANADAVAEVVQHRDEVEELKQRIGSATPRFHAVVFRELLGEWARQPTPAWLADHIDELRERYELVI